MATLSPWAFLVTLALVLAAFLVSPWFITGIAGLGAYDLIQSLRRR